MMIRHCYLCKEVLPTDGERVAFNLVVYLNSGAGREYREIQGDAHTKCFPTDLLRLVEVYGQTQYRDGTEGSTTSVPVMEDAPADARERSCVR